MIYLSPLQWIPGALQYKFPEINTDKYTTTKKAVLDIIFENGRNKSGERIYFWELSTETGIYIYYAHTLN
ncbi:MAG: hypothetical protein WDM78_13890 [Puia sp.]